MFCRCGYGAIDLSPNAGVSYSQRKTSIECLHARENHFTGVIGFRVRFRDRQKRRAHSHDETTR